MALGAASLRLVALVTTTFATLTSLTATVRQSAASNMGSPDVIATGPTVAAADLTVGKKLLDISWPSIAPVAAKRYLDMNFTVAGSSATAGAIWAGIVMNNEGGELKIGNTGGSVV